MGQRIARHALLRLVTEFKRQPAHLAGVQLDILHAERPNPVETQKFAIFAPSASYHAKNARIVLIM